MSSANALAQLLHEFLLQAEPPTRGQLKEAARAVVPRSRDCRADEEFRESLTSRQREVLEEDGIGDDDDDDDDRAGGGCMRQNGPVKDVVGMQVDVSAQYKVTCNSYKEMLGKIKICELDVLLEDRYIEELRLDSLDVKYTMNDTRAKVTLQQEPPLPEVNSV